MSNTPTTTSGGPWRILLLDRGDDPKWILCVVTLPDDVRPAVLDSAGRYTGWLAAAGWVAGLTGRPATLVPVADALAWRVDESR
jgi:hypothetical protein